MSYNSLIDFMFELDGYFLVTDDSSYFSPFVPGYSRLLDRENIRCKESP